MSEVKLKTFITKMSPQQAYKIGILCAGTYVNVESVRAVEHEREIEMLNKEIASIARGALKLKEQRDETLRSLYGKYLSKGFVGTLDADVKKAMEP